MSAKLKTVPKLRYKDWMSKEEYELSRKLQFRYFGVYTIQEILSPITYRILKEDGKLQTVSIRNLQPVGLNMDMELFQRIFFSSCDIVTNFNYNGRLIVY